MTDKKQQPLSIRLPAPLMKWIRTLQEETGSSQSDVIRRKLETSQSERLKKNIISEWTDKQNFNKAVCFTLSKYNYAAPDIAFDDLPQMHPNSVYAFLCTYVYEGYSKGWYQHGTNADNYFTIVSIIAELAEILCPLDEQLRKDIYFKYNVSELNQLKTLVSKEIALNEKSAGVFIAHEIDLRPLSWFVDYLCNISRETMASIFTPERIKPLLSAFIYGCASKDSPLPVKPLDILAHANNTNSDIQDMPNTDFKYDPTNMVLYFMQANFGVKFSPTATFSLIQLVMKHDASSILAHLKMREFCGDSLRMSFNVKPDYVGITEQAQHYTVYLSETEFYTFVNALSDVAATEAAQYFIELHKVQYGCL